MDARELLEMVPLVGEVGKPFIGAIADVLDSDEFRRLMDLQAELLVKGYTRLVKDGIPPEHAILMVVSTKVALSEVARQKK